MFFARIVNRFLNSLFFLIDGVSFCESMHYFIKSPDLVHMFANATKKAEPVLCLSKKLY